MWWRRQPVARLTGEPVSMEVAEFMVLGFNADGINVYTVSVDPTMAKVAWTCPDADTGAAWVTLADKAHVFIGMKDLLQELMSS